MASLQFRLLPAYLTISAFAIPTLMGCSAPAADSGSEGEPSSATGWRTHPLPDEEPSPGQSPYAVLGGTCFDSTDDGPVCKPHTGLYCAREDGAPRSVAGRCVYYVH